jgi:hypothetical protein
MAYLHTILAYPSKPRLKGALNRIYGYLSRYRARTDKTLTSERSFAQRGTLSSIGYLSSPRPPSAASLVGDLCGFTMTSMVMLSKMKASSASVATFLKSLGKTG